MTADHVPATPAPVCRRDGHRLIAFPVYPGVTPLDLVGPRPWIEVGNPIVSAGVSAGIDMVLHLAARLTDEATARTVQPAIDDDPRPPYGGIDHADIPPLPRAMRAAIGLAAPAVTARPGSWPDLPR